MVVVVPRAELLLWLLDVIGVSTGGTEGGLVVDLAFFSGVARGRESTSFRFPPVLVCFGDFVFVTISRIPSESEPISEKVNEIQAKQHSAHNHLAVRHLPENPEYALEELDGFSSSQSASVKYSNDEQDEKPA